ncbi:uncharacterized protein CLAFUR5_12958 [Fulvia fulva]|uniref:Uncharacterized protein n=1 Tax=Passalora fulva TaxID=5499 RepID=A0A9Q8PJ06_PASFU|nr:uncharacterized protein CLAFUR5_12958 [Fulvia fulva]UJO23353.1 hypothetical protein CLAFUR5_12958 [Fulvia fulva]WPV36567.1 hypothetical protein CLAFUW7_13107 [Fulvia fulva]
MAQVPELTEPHSNVHIDFETSTDSETDWSDSDSEEKPTKVSLRLDTTDISATNTSHSSPSASSTSHRRSGPASASTLSRTLALRRELLPHFYQTRVSIMCENVDSERRLRNVGAWLTAVKKEHRPHIRGVQVRTKEWQPDESYAEEAWAWAWAVWVWMGKYGLEMEPEDGEVCERDEKDMVWNIKFL